MQKQLNIQSLIEEYLLKEGYFQTLEKFQQENKNSDQKTNIIAVLILYLDQGNSDVFFRLFNQMIQENKEDLIYMRLEFNLQLYFVSQAIQKNNNMQQALSNFQSYMEQNSLYISKENDFLQYYALPYVQNAKNHPAFKHLFSPAFSKQIKVQLQNFVQKHATYEQAQLTNIIQNYQQNEQQEENMQVLDALQKWITACKDLFFISKRLYQYVEKLKDGNEIDQLYLYEMNEKLFKYQKILDIDLDNLEYQEVTQILYTSKDNIQINEILRNLRKSLNITEVDKSLSMDLVKLQQYIEHNILSIQNIETILFNNHINLQVSKLLNLISCEKIGRSYLLQNENLIKQLLLLLFSSQQRDQKLYLNVLAVLQKLSLRKKAQMVMLQNSIVEHLMEVLEEQNVDEFILEYCCALLMNLSLSSYGRNQLEKFDLLQLIIDKYLQHENEQIRTYINGTLYSILSKESIKQKAKFQNLTQIMYQIQQDTDNEEQWKQIAFIIEKINNLNTQSASE